ncbi:MAG: hypothetical protein AVDCRST_MAG89-1858 [uncultured Gemmatimonadetes bacterium]|uniref:Lipocalin-like domain-containing protein n=1 Tax=uncultured Gemmatimonadota bacterium TaxID=203437 RepID=A0A6J4L7T8_9BACT|nr:MAG: hypothetical protein AVDCRST_MAG89-1858 [uncultured Gemmatimonadota bacterium]
MTRMWIRTGALKIPIAAVAGTCALLACQENTPRVRTESNVAGEYVLTERDGQRLPHTMRVASQKESCEMTLIRTVIVLRQDGSYGGESEGYSRCGGQARPDSTTVERFSGRFQLRGARGDTIALNEDPPIPGVTDRGVFDGDELAVTMEVRTGERRTIRLRYVRQDTEP